MPTSPRTRRGLQRWLSATSTPVFLLDARRVVLFFNQGCEQLTGVAAAAVIGKRCDYASETGADRAESVTGRLCPPPEVFDGRACCVPADFHQGEGGPFAATIHFGGFDARGVPGATTKRVPRAPSYSRRSSRLPMPPRNPVRIA